MTAAIERLEYLQEDGSPAFLEKRDGVWLSDKVAITWDAYLACASCQRPTFWQQRGPWFITTFVGAIFGFGVCKLFF